MIERSERLLLTVPEAAWRLGLSRATVYELVAAREISVIKVGRATRIPAAELVAWVERRSTLAEAGQRLEPETQIGFGAASDGSTCSDEPHR